MDVSRPSHDSSLDRDRDRISSFDSADSAAGLSAPPHYHTNDMAALSPHLREEGADELPPLRDQLPGSLTPASASHPPPPAPSASYSGVTTPSSPHNNSYGFPTPRPRNPASRDALNTIDTAFPAANAAPQTPSTARSHRPPAAARTPSHAYAPPRRPSQFSLSKTDRKSSTSSIRARVAQAEADYRAQKKLYLQRLQQDIAEENAPASPDDYPPSLAYSGESDDDDDVSPGGGDQLDKDMYDPEALMYYGNVDDQPSAEELKIPENRERLEWHSMLANVLTGDVVSQEKRRLIGTGNQPGGDTYKAELWTGVRAKCCGRTIPAQKKMVEDQRARISTYIEEVVTFEIKGETEVGMTARQQVEEVVRKIERIEGLYQSRNALVEAHPRAGSADFVDACDALVSWHNTTLLINMQLAVLQSWVGNDELDFSKALSKGGDSDQLADESAFIERILKEDGLKPLQGDTNMLIAVDKVIEKAKQTLIENSEAFARKHLPPYIEELLTLLNFPSRLVQEIIRMRLSYTKQMKAEVQQNSMMAEQLISQFRILLNLAQRIKTQYNIISQPQPGWELPPSLDENFDSTVLDAIRFYFKMLSFKLSANRNTFKEAEVLEQEWGLISFIGKHFQRGDVEIAEQFSALTSKSLLRLTAHFERELERKPDEVGPEVDRRYRQILDSVRVRQRKLFRFSRLLSSAFENACEYSIPTTSEDYETLWGLLIETGHLMVNITTEENSRATIIASPLLQSRAKGISELIGAAYQHIDETADMSDPYVLILHSDSALPWDGATIDVDMILPKLDIKPGRLRLVTECATGALQNAKNTFIELTGFELDVILAQRANLSNVDKELSRIRRVTWKLSHSIMESVDVIRQQVEGLDCVELIQSCFAFATEFGQRSLLYMDPQRRTLNNMKLTRLALDWISFICDDCPASERKTFRWAVVALEFAMLMTRGQNLISMSGEEYAKLRQKVSGCMSLLISHFDIMGARSTVAAQAEKARLDAMGSKFKIDVSKLKTDEESAEIVQQQWLDQLASIDEMRNEREAEIKPLGRVLENSTEADRSLMLLSAYATNVTLRWQQGQFIGGGTFGSVYVATNIDSGHLMAVKEIRLQDPQVIPRVVNQIRDEMSVLQILSHDNVVSYHGIEVHRDKVYIFMEYCSGGSLANLLEHGRIEDETVIKVYALQLLEGLAYLHESGVIHRDIKPENVLLDHNGVIKYVDFGAAKIIARQSGRTLMKDGTDRGALQRSMTGTPMYMSPEVIRGSGSGPMGAGTPASTPSSPSSPQARPGAADIWSLGCVILEMATGRRPWASLDNEWAIMYNIAQGNTPALPTPEQLSDAGIDFLRKCFERDPLRRASAVELLQHDWIMDLRNMLNLEPDPATPSTDSGTSSRLDGSGAVSRQESGLSSSTESTSSDSRNATVA